MFCSKCGTAVGEGQAFCGTCGQPVPGAVTASSPAPVAIPPLPPAVGVPAVSTPPVLYAGFWLRVVAAIIDGLVLAIPSGLVSFLSLASAIPFLMRSPDPMTVMITILPRLLMLLVICLAGSWLYWALMESSARQATLGKMALGLYVTDLSGNRATFGRTSGRFFAGRGIGFVPSVGGLYFLISCILAGFTEKKQALHDIIANCLVLRRA
jgi:uncharacterized RDD family membrane protein YckC